MLKIGFVLLSISLFISLPAKSAVDCNVSKYEPVAEAGKLLNREIILLGEVHGNQESPAVATEIICLAAKSGQRVVLALEAPADVSPDVFLGSETSAETIQKSEDYWLKPAHEADGRTSQSIKQAIRYLGNLRKQRGLTVEIVTVDIPKGSINQSHMRDQVMGEALLELQSSGKYDRVFFYGGHFHTRLANAADSNTITSFLPRTQYTTVLIYPLSGSTWACMGPRGNIECTDHDLPGHAGVTVGAKWQLHRVTEKSGITYDGLIQLDKVNASMPITEF